MKDKGRKQILAVPKPEKSETTEAPVESTKPKSQDDFRKMLFGKK